MGPEPRALPVVLQDLLGPKGLDSLSKGLDFLLNGLDSLPKELDSLPKGLDFLPNGLDFLPNGLDSFPEGLDPRTAVLGIALGAVDIQLYRHIVQSCGSRFRNTGESCMKKQYVSPIALIQKALSRGELPEPMAIPAVPEGERPLDGATRQSLLKIAAEQRAEVDQAMEEL